MAYQYEWVPSPNYHSGMDVKGFCVHHAATTDFDGIGRVFSSSSRQASTHYGVSPTKRHQYVDESNCSWHAGETWANNHLISCECVNSTGDPTWNVDDRTVENLCDLMAGVAYRHGLYPYKRNVNLFGHKDFSATMCPGVLYDRLDEIANRANKIYKEKYMNTKSAKAQQWDTHLGEHQQLVFSKKDSKGYVTIKSKANGKYLAYAGGKTDDGTGVLFFDSTNDDDQKWKRVWVSVGGISYLTLRPKNDLTKCLSVAGANKDNGASLCLWTYYEGKEQLWTRVPMATRTHVLVNRCSHKALDCDA